MKIDADIALEIACHEALIRQAYRDSTGTWTWGFGLTSATGHQVERYIDNPQSLERCLAIYVWALDNYAEHVRDVFDGIPLSKEEFTAILSWTWNLGGGALRRASWVDLYKHGSNDVAELSFKSWNKAGGVRNTGLVNRRQKEADLLFRSKWSNDGRVLEYTKLAPSHAPDWTSAQWINVRAALRNAIDAHTQIEPDHPPKPNAPVTPTLSPDVDRVVHNLLLRLLDWLRRWLNET